VCECSFYHSDARLAMGEMRQQPAGHQRTATCDFGLRMESAGVALSVTGGATASVGVQYAGETVRGISLLVIGCVLVLAITAVWTHLTSLRQSLRRDQQRVSRREPNGQICFCMNSPGRPKASLRFGTAAIGPGLTSSPPSDRARSSCAARWCEKCRGGAAIKPRQRDSHRGPHQLGA
jgi:hypothetical protein